MARYTPGASEAEPDLSELWWPPETPHAYDEEFDSTTLDPAWTWGEWGAFSTVAGTPDVYGANPTDQTYSLAQRPSWLRVQPVPGSGGSLSRSITCPTNFLVWARCSFQLDTNIAANEIAVGILIGDGVDSVVLYLNENDSGQTQAQFGPSATETTDVDAKGQALEYVVLHKVGSTIHGWVGTESNWIYMGSAAASWTPNTVMVHWWSGGTANNIAAGDAPWIVGCDFIRFIETDKFPF